MSVITFYQNDEELKEPFALRLLCTQKKKKKKKKILSMSPHFQHYCHGPLHLNYRYLAPPPFLEHFGILILCQLPFLSSSPSPHIQKPGVFLFSQLALYAERKSSKVWKQPPWWGWIARGQNSGVLSSWHHLKCWTLGCQFEDRFWGISWWQSFQYLNPLMLWAEFMKESDFNFSPCLI